MTQVYKRLSWKEKAALSLMRGCDGETGKGKRKQFKRADIPKIRKMAWDGHSKEYTIKALGIDMDIPCFTRKCKELQIKFGYRR